MAGKKWTPERHAQEAARRANEAAQAVQASGVKPEFQPDTLTDGEVRQNKTKNPNWSALDEMESASDKRSFGEEAVTEPEPEPQAQAKPEPTPQAQPDPESAPEPETSPEPVAAAPAAPSPQTVKQVVDGKEYEVSQDEIDEAGGDRAWRIQRASLNRHEEAKAAMAEAKRVQAQTAQLAQILQNQFQPQQQPQQQPQYTEEQLLEYMRSGTPEQAKAAWGELKKGMTPTDPTVIENRTMFKVNQKSAAEAFRKEFQDIASNPDLMGYAAFLENQRLPKALQEAGIVNPADPRLGLFDFPNFYRSIGNQIRGALPRSSQPQAAPTTTSQPSQPSEKEARKASIVTLPTAAARVQPPAEDKPQSRMEILAEEAKARGKVAPHG